MWLPGARNLHSARETWKIRSDIATSIDKLVKSVENIETDEHMLVHKVCVLLSVKHVLLSFATCTYM